MKNFSKSHVSAKKCLILAVDDDETSLRLIKKIIEPTGHVVVTACNGLEALSLLANNEFDLIVTDLFMPEMDGFALLDELQIRDSSVPVIVVTACGSIENAVLAVRKGAYDFVEKPFNAENFIITLQRALNHFLTLAENRKIKEYLQKSYPLINLETHNSSMKHTLEMAIQVASSNRTTVAIYGESGTGKEVIARSIHYFSTGVPTGFVALNCAAIPEHLLESELFGHTKGAFTGATSNREGKFSLAKGGTLLLDEIGDMPMNLQCKLLRVLQERTFEPLGSNELLPLECRIIIATNTNLSELVAAGKFREDLYHRINVFPLFVPPLRERKEDIPLISDYFLDELRAHLGKPLPGISQKAMELLLAYSWPGNVRELRNCLERAAILTAGDLIRPEHLVINESLHSSRLPDQSDSAGVNYTLTIPPENLSLAALTQQILSITLTRCGGNKSKAAALLKTDRRVFYKV